MLEEAICKFKTMAPSILPDLIDNFWLDRDKETRKKMLADVYQRIVGKPKKD